MAIFGLFVLFLFGHLDVTEIFLLPVRGFKTRGI